MTTTNQPGTIDGVDYASSQDVYDPYNDGTIAQILYFDQSGTEIADRSAFTIPAWYDDVGKTTNSDGSFTVKLVPMGANGGLDPGYTLETFSSTGVWEREDVFLPIFTDPTFPGQGTVSGYTDNSYTIVNLVGTGSSGIIDGAHYDMVESHYTGSGKLLETDYFNDLDDTPTLVAAVYQPNPVVNAISPVTATAGAAAALDLVSVSDPWAAGHPGTLALTISVDSGTVTGTDSSGNAFTVTAGSAEHLTGTLAQINVDLAGLVFTDQTAGTAQVSYVVYDQAGLSASAVETVTVGAPGTGVSWTPGGELIGSQTMTVPATGQAQGLNHILSDPWAVGHPGSLALNASTTFGTLSDIVTGQSGTSLHFTGGYSQIAADLAGLQLASSQAGSGSVRLEVFDQAGAETVAVIGVTAHASASA